MLEQGLADAAAAPARLDEAGLRDRARACARKVEKLVKNSANADDPRRRARRPAPRPTGRGAEQVRRELLGRDLQQVGQLLELGQAVDQADDRADVAQAGGADREVGACGRMKRRRSCARFWHRRSRAPTRCHGADRRCARCRYSDAMDLDPIAPRRARAAVSSTARGLRQHAARMGRRQPRSRRRAADRSSCCTAGWTSRRRSSSSSTRCRAIATCIALDWRGFGAERHAAGRHLLLPEYLGDLELVPRRAVRRRRARRSTCSATAWAATSRCSTPACGRDASAASSTSKASACRARSRQQAPGADRAVARRAEDADAAAPVRRRSSAVAERLQQDQPAAARRPRRAGSPRSGRGRTRQTARPACAPARRPEPQAHEPAHRPGRRMARVLEADHRAGALDRRRPHRRQRLVGQAATPRPSSTSG